MQRSNLVHTIVKLKFYVQRKLPEDVFYNNNNVIPVSQFLPASVLPATLERKAARNAIK